LFQAYATAEDELLPLDEPELPLEDEEPPPELPLEEALPLEELELPDEPELPEALPLDEPELLEEPPDELEEEVDEDDGADPPLPPPEQALRARQANMIPKARKGRRLSPGTLPGCVECARFDTVFIGYLHDFLLHAAGRPCAGAENNWSLLPRMACLMHG